MHQIAVARHAMATRFEIVLWGDHPVHLRAAGEEALDEIERLEARLSLYQSTSDISRINRRASREPVRVDPALFRLLQRARRLSEETEGAFDITIAPLVRCWGFLGGTGALPDPARIEEARSKVGMNFVELSESDFTIRFAKEGMMLDLGSIGKGYALERAVDLLQEAGVKSALLHGGTSTVFGLGTPPGGEGWKVAVEWPPASLKDSEASAAAPSEARSEGGQVAAVVLLKDEALSVSAVHGKSFQTEGKVHGHVIDPRSGQTVQGALLSAVVLPSATETDAVSTALLIGGPEESGRLASRRPGLRSLLIYRSDEPPVYRWAACGIEVRASALSSA